MRIATGWSKRNVHVRAALALAAIGLAGAVAGSRARACDCAEPTVPEAFDRADSVFGGEVVEIDRSDDSVRVRVDVFAIWKGPLATHIDVWTAPDSALCGVNFVLGDEFIVYARVRDASTSSAASDAISGSDDRSLAITAAPQAIASSSGSANPSSSDG